MKILLAEPGVPGMTKSEIDSFLGNGKMILRLATVDKHGDAMIHPVWYLFENDRIYLFSNHKARKVENMTKNGRVYFSIDTDAMPNKGVRGKGRARVVREEDRRVSLGEKIVRRYLGDTQSEYAKSLLGFVRTGRSLVVEITPRYYTVWDYGKMM